MKLHALKIFFIAGAIALAAILVFQNGFLDAWQEKIFDTFFLKSTPSKDIVIFAIDNESIAVLGQWPWDRSIFANAIAKLQKAAVIGLDVNFSEPSAQNPTSDTALATALANSKPKVVLPVQVDQRTDEVVGPLPQFKQFSQQGLVNMYPDIDGTVRFIQKPNSTPLFAETIAHSFDGTFFVPSKFRVDYRGPARTFLTLPINDLLQGAVPERIYEDKIVLIGATAPDLHDVFHTPFGLVPGVEIHANTIDTLLGQKFYQNLNPIASIAFIILLCGAAAVLIYTVKRFALLVPVLAVIFILTNIAGAIAFSYNLVLPILYLDAAFLLTSAVLITLEYTVTSQEKKFIYTSFKQYLSEDLIKELLQDPKKLALRGEKRTVSILFSDIRDFTTMSEGLDPEQLVRVMNVYFEAMSDIIINSRGMIEKYIGDAICAFWGAPVHNSNHAIDACRTAIRMVKAAKQVNKELGRLKFSQRVRIGVGVNTGTVVVGNMGSAKRFNYGMVGDNVNLTSRLEGLNKTYNTEIIISQATKQAIEGNPEFRVRDLGMATVKGRNEPIHIFELLAEDMVG